MNARQIGDIALRHEIEDMRLGHHPAPLWEREAKYFILRTIVKYMPHSPEVEAEAWAEHGAMRLNAPARPCERRGMTVVSG